MEKKICIDNNELNPFIRKVGIQDSTGWSGLRKLYDYEMLYFIRGKGRVEVAEQQFQLSTGSLILLPPNTPNKLYVLDKDSYIIWVHFDFIYFSEGKEIDYDDRQLMQKHLIRPKIFLSNGTSLSNHFKVHDQDAMTSNFEEILRSYHQKDLYWQIKCKSIMLDIFYRLLKQVNTKETYSNTISKERIIQDMLQYIHYHYNYKLQLEEIADYAGVSVNYANTLFKERTNETIIQYLNHYRLKKAIKIIESSNQPIGQVAEQVGFSNPHYFSRIMKKYTGKSPKEYRNE
ncbi:AraC family transcriptional regulator [Vallitalea okinawensis]|uniref:AraC family transcriptional regulator n=1 Tax=Vallitalea okinawensis TaxID=2078660 RepID=UPI000CFB0BF2|nr:AraC family transcriptional regulator [Vallitalea okinawensis]